MTPTDLSILIQEGEGTTLEFKENLSSSFAREAVAMANTIGGKILLGVRDDGTIAGLQDSNLIRARVQDIARNCDPPVKLMIEPVEKVMVVHVRESDAKPVQCSEGFFWRQGAVTQKLSRDEIREFFRTEGVVRFDLAPCPRFRYPRDFDEQKFAAWLKLSGISGRPRAEDVLVNIEAAERAAGRLLFRNAGVLFFAKNARHFFPQAYVTCLLAKGTDKVHILDRKDFEGGIVADIGRHLNAILGYSEILTGKLKAKALKVTKDSPWKITVQLRSGANGLFIEQALIINGDLTSRADIHVEMLPGRMRLYQNPK